MKKKYGKNIFRLKASYVWFGAKIPNRKMIKLDGSSDGRGERKQKMEWRNRSIKRVKVEGCIAQLVEKCLAWCFYSAWYKFTTKIRILKPPSRWTLLVNFLYWPQKWVSFLFFLACHLFSTEKFYKAYGRLCIRSFASSLTSKIKVGFSGNMYF